jgi:hypothetical protein
VTLADLAVDFATVFELPPEAVLPDLVAAAQHLGHLGVLDGVASWPTDRTPDRPAGSEPPSGTLEQYEAPDYLYVAPDG